jgi:hypothetical protein
MGKKELKMASIQTEVVPLAQVRSQDFSAKKSDFQFWTYFSRNILVFFLLFLPPDE